MLAFSSGSVVGFGVGDGLVGFRARVVRVRTERVMRRVDTFCYFGGLENGPLFGGVEARVTVYLEVGLLLWI